MGSGRGGCMYKHKVFLVVLSVLCSLLPSLLYSQVDTAWVRRYNGPSSDFDRAIAMVVDRQGNVHVTGWSHSLISGIDYATIKYNASGIQQWVVRYDLANGTDYASALAVDDSGNVYVTGQSWGSNGYYDYATVKYNASGIQQWVATYNGPGNNEDVAYAIAVDDAENVYVTGVSYGLSSGYDFATIKYNSNGDIVWVRRYIANSDMWNNAIVVDDLGNVYVTGASYGLNTCFDYMTIKYNESGAQQWVAIYNGPSNNCDRPTAMVVDGSGNVFVTGFSDTSYYYATIKYNSLGVEQWVARYNGTGNSQDDANAIAVDGQGNVYVTGSSIGSGTDYDYATIKYNSAGVQQWVQRYNGPGNDDDHAYSLAVDGQGNAYVTGSSRNSSSSSDYATIKYNSTGVEQWIQRYSGPGNYYNDAYFLVVDGQGNVYVTGASSGLGTDYDYATIKYVQTSGLEENRHPLSANHILLEIYPNPAKTYFTFRIPQSADHSVVKIFDVNGNIVKSEELKGKNNRISLDGIKNGVYFVKVGDELISKKLVVTK